MAFITEEEKQHLIQLQGSYQGNIIRLGETELRISVLEEQLQSLKGDKYGLVDALNSSHVVEDDYVKGLIEKYGNFSQINFQTGELVVE